MNKMWIVGRAFKAYSIKPTLNYYFCVEKFLERKKKLLNAVIYEISSVVPSYKFLLVSKRGNKSGSDRSI